MLDLSKRGEIVHVKLGIEPTEQAQREGTPLELLQKKMETWYTRGGHKANCKDHIIPGNELMEKLKQEPFPNHKSLYKALKGAGRNEAQIYNEIKKVVLDGNPASKAAVKAVKKALKKR